MLDTVEMVEVERRKSKRDTTWYSQGEFATLEEIDTYNARHNWRKARPKTGEK